MVGNLQSEHTGVRRPGTVEWMKNSAVLVSLFQALSPFKLDAYIESI